ncbi:hypothetical protein QJQ45_015240 [Haematococcus lacustris]|nr:hypothetical protein QJQ45_015240 [Haematococcus lacustris]
MSQHSFLGPTPAEDYDEEEADVVDGDCDDEPLTLGVFNLMPDVNAPVPDVSRYQMMAMDPSIAKAQLHSTVCPKTDATEKSLLKSTFAFFFEAHLKGVYADGITVPLCYKGLLRELLVDVSDDIQDITHRLYVWVNERVADLCVLFCAYAARKYARNSKAKGEDGLGLKFPPKSFVHRFNCIAHQLFLHHQSLDRQGRAVPSFVRPQFLDAKHRVWGQLWNTVDGASKLAAQAELYSLTRNSFAEYTDPKDAESRVMYKLDPLACKNWNGGLKDAGRPPPCKFIVPNPDYVATGDSYADAKLLLEKLPTPCAVDALFLKANAEYQKKNLWYIAQPLGIKTLSERVKAVTGYSSHCMKRTGATALAEDETCSDEFRLAMGGWKSRDAMAAYAHHGVAKRAKASALMSSQVCVPLPAPAVPVVVPPPTPTASIAEAAVPPSTPSVVHPPIPSHTPSLGVCVGEGVAPGSSSTPPPPNPLMHGFVKWPTSGVPLADQMATMAQQMAAFQVQMQLTSLQMQVQVMQQNMLSKKE